jgi:hypothetical protein
MIAGVMLLGAPDLAGHGAHFAPLTSNSKSVHVVCFTVESNTAAASSSAIWYASAVSLSHRDR